MALFARSRTCTAFQGTRAFSTTTQRRVSLQLDKNDQEAVKDIVPLYPYGSNRWYKQSNLGLYGGQRIQFGNNVSETFGVKTRRKWRPNVRTKKLWSNALQGSVQVRVTTRTLRTIDKLGGLDEYVLGEKEARIKELGETGWWLRWAIMQTPVIRKRFATERAALGVDDLARNITDTQEAVEPEAIEMNAQADLDQQTPRSRSPLPRIRFRTGRRKHLTLTPNGWRRARPAYRLELANRYSEGVRDLVDTQVAELVKLVEQEVELDTKSKVEVVATLKSEIRRKVRRLRAPWYHAQKEATIQAEDERRRAIKLRRRGKQQARQNKRETRLSEQMAQITL